MNDEIRAFAESMRQQGASAQEIERYIQGAVERQKSEIAPPPAIQADAAKDASAVVQNPQEGRETTGDFQKLRDLGLGLATTAPQAIPGVEAAQAGIRSVARGQPYAEALSDMRAKTDPIPAPLKLAVQAPAIAATAALPLSPALSGAALGGLSQLLNADPSQSFGDRAFRTALGAGTGAALGKTLDIAGTLGRAWKPGAPSSGAVIQDIEKSMKAGDARNYGMVAKEAAQSPQQVAGIRRILDSNTVKGFADDVRASDKFANADDATVLGEVYSSMGAAERSLKKALAREYNPDTARKLADIVKAKRNLLSEADKVTPSLRPAVVAHAIKEGQIKAVGTGVNAAKRAFGATPGGDQLRNQSVEKYAERIAKMSPEDRAKAVSAALAETRQRTGFQPNAVSLGGLLTSIQRPMKMASFLRNAGDEGQKVLDFVNRLVLGEAANATR